MKTPNIALPGEWKRNVRAAMIQVTSLAHWSLIHTRAWCANSPVARVQLAGKLEQAHTELAQIREEMRIKDSRMTGLPPHRRPFYAPAERLAILALKAARGWNLARTARAFLVTPETVAEWMKRTGDDGDKPLVQLPQPVNKYPDYVCQIVRKLKTLCPLMGKKRIADTLGRAGLHLAVTTVKRMLEAKPISPTQPPVKAESADALPAETPGRIVTAKHPNHVWHVDLTVVPTSIGLWTAWFPFTSLQIWPFCWWVIVFVDHFSRKAMGFAVFTKQPTSEEARAALGRAMSKQKAKPKHLISDRGPQFDCKGFKTWAKRKKINLRYGAVGKYGSIAIVERFIRSMKSECFGLILVPFRLSQMREDIACYIAWFNELRAHQGLGGKTPSEAATAGAVSRPQFETRGKNAVRLKLVVSHFRNRRHLPVVELQKVA